MNLLRRIEVGANAVLVPRAAEFFGDRAGTCSSLGEREVCIALPVVKNGSTQVGVASVVRALEAKHDAGAADQRIGGVLLDIDAVDVA